MSLNISKSILDIAEEINIEVNIAKMGPRQQATFKRMAQDGVCKTSSAPGHVASVWRRLNNLPVVEINRWSVAWHNVPKDSEWFDRCQAACVAAKLDISPHTQAAYVNAQIKEIEELLDAKPASSDGRMAAYYIRDRLIDVAGKFKFPKPDTTPPQFITIPREYL